MIRALFGKALLLAAVTVAAMAPQQAKAEGTEILGPAQIPLAAGSGFAIGGTGLFEVLGENDFANVDGSIAVAVPQGAEVKQVLLYWISEHYPQSGGANVATVNGNTVVGTSIGGPTNFFSVVYFEAFRADITDLGLVGPGANTLDIDAIDSSFRTTGAGVLVIYDDGTAADLQVQDGLDLVYWRLVDPLDRTEPVTFAFEPSNSLRIARIPVFVGSVAEDRPNVTEITVGNQTNVFYNLFSSLDGVEWDSHILEVDVPAGVTEVTMQLKSEGDGSGLNPASMAWVASGIAIRIPDTPKDPCAPCDGRVTELSLEYLGSTPANIVVSQKTPGPGPKDTVIFDGLVQPGGVFDLIGVDRQNTLGPEITIFVNGSQNTRIHTSCSVPIGPGLVSGAFKVVAGESRNGGLLCPIEGGGEGEGEGEGEEDCECEGRVNNLTLRYDGSAAAQIRVNQMTPGPGPKDADIFNAVVQPGATFNLVGVDRQGTLGPEIRLFVNGAENTRIHTSCSVPIGPGLVSGAFTVVSGTSRVGGALCPLNGGGEGGGEGEGEGEGEDDPTPRNACEDGKPTALTLLYTGEGCDASDNAQSDRHVDCSGNPNGAGLVRIIATDKNNPNHHRAKYYFDGEVAIGETFDASAAAANERRLKANLYVYVYSLSGNLLQSVKFHVSCSEPLIIGDQFGSLQLTGFLAEKTVDADEVVPVASLVAQPPALGCAAGTTGGNAARGDFAVLAIMLGVLAAFVARRRHAESGR